MWDIGQGAGLPEEETVFFPWWDLGIDGSVEGCVGLGKREFVRNREL